ncbi:DUF3502 domain-containing protein [Paenibacillus sp. JDR-2]|uniref:DUF3502 domain-containing protein n=1 Tax=Paenibacillus sp. (strain JDR-2) TaxID=324057 RepID=UPI0001668F7B|nr:DUF3502 domain-containing protein [Paenibacillus sp. JDR-2]ACS99589.1 extracellular solute-binding protein family 1 [Paenibacillus sp. JDR-2]
MIRKTKSLFTMLALIAMIALLLAACSSNSNNTNNTPASSKGSEEPSASASPAEGSKETAAADSGNDHSEEVKLVGYLLGEAPKGMPDVMAALNEKLKKDINATLEINYIGWGDIAAKYPLILASGEDVDFVFTADWNFYVPEANKGSFKELTQEMFQKYMPKYAAKQDPAAYKAAQVNGKQYMIPTTTPDRKVGVIVLRKDVMEKAGLTNPTKISELGPYFAEIKKDYPNMIPLNLDSQYDLPAPFGALVQEKFAYAGAPLDSGDPSGVGNYTDQEDATGKILSMTDEPVQGAFKYAAGIMKQWYDAGYVNKNPYSNKIRSKDNFCDGKSGVAFGNSIDIQATLSSCQDKNIDTYIMPVLSPTGHAPSNSWLNNGVAIAANSKHPERAMEALDLIMENQDYVFNAYYGIEGKNYVLTADDKLALPDGVTAADNTYPPDAAGFWFVDKDYFKPSASWTDSYIELNNKIKDFLQPIPYLGFTFNTDNVKTEIANLKNVSTQYFMPLAIGAVKDVDKQFDSLNSKMKAAGVDKVKTELETQASAFLAAKG